MSKKRTKDLHVNRKYKDSLFRMIFSDKKIYWNSITLLMAVITTTQRI